VRRERRRRRLSKRGLLRRQTSAGNHILGGVWRLAVQPAGVTLAQKRQLWIISFAIIAMGVALFIIGGHFEVRARMDRVVAWVRDAGPVPFFTAMTVLPMVGFPLSGFTLVAGPVFGPTMGVGLVVLCGILAITINVAVTYWLAARALRPVAVWVVQRLGYRMPEIPRDAAWLAIIVLRTVPVTPFSLQGVLLGLARVPFGPYMLVSVIVPSTYATAMIVLGDALMRGDRWAMAGAGALFIVVGVILHFMRKRLRPRAPSLRVTPEDK
jgi:uncharacterized membrane protein YdjX (TVP38/TMEM64 family)